MWECSASKHLINNRNYGTYNIFGRVEGMDRGVIYLQIFDSTERGPTIDIDSAKITDSYFHLTGRTVLPFMAKLNTEPGWRNLRFSKFFVLDTGVTNFLMSSDSASSSIVVGSKLNDQLTKVNKTLREMKILFQDKYFPLNKQGIISDDSLDVLKRQHDSSIFQLILEEAFRNPKSIVVAFVANREGALDLVGTSASESLVKILEHSDNYFTRKLRQDLATTLRTDVGGRLPAFSITDNAGKRYTNGSFEGRYLFVDFWASWCAPCRAENPNLVRMYRRFRDEKFSMVSISVDADIGNWEKAVKEDSMKWIQALADRGDEMEIKFGIRYIPANFLVDPKGKIIGRNLTGTQMEKVSDSLFDSSAKTRNVLPRTRKTQIQK